MKLNTRTNRAVSTAPVERSLAFREASAYKGAVVEEFDGNAVVLLMPSGSVKVLRGDASIAFVKDLISKGEIENPHYCDMCRGSNQVEDSSPCPGNIVS